MAKGIYISEQLEILCALFILTAVTVFIMFTNSIHSLHNHKMQWMHRKHIQKNKYFEMTITIENGSMMSPSTNFSDEINGTSVAHQLLSEKNMTHLQNTGNHDLNLKLLSSRKGFNSNWNPFSRISTLLKVLKNLLNLFQTFGNQLKRGPKPGPVNVSHSSINTRSSQNSLMLNSTGPKFISIGYEGRLGNNMFQYASLLGIAQRNNLVAVDIGDNPLSRVFKIKTTSRIAMLNRNIPLRRTYGEKRGCTFEYQVFNLGASENVMLYGYFQSWKYFADQSTTDRLKHQDFQFHDDLRMRATVQLIRIISPKVRNYEGNVTFIAVHIRRGDMVHRDDYVKYGYTTPNITYLNRAMTKFRFLYNNCLFILASDDLDWCYQNIKNDDVVFIPRGNPPELDMAILAQCNHTLMTVGSYGWWVAWLVGGTTIYYSGYPTPNSKLAELFNSADYRPESWIGMM